MTNAILKEDLPQSYTVKYLGNDEAHGLWGIKHTRKPVDNLVSRAKKPGTYLPVVNLTVTSEGVRIEAPNQPVSAMKRKNAIKSDKASAWLPIDTISYGVQDLVYTRVFSIIVVQDCTDIKVKNNNIPFVCYAFVCDSRQIARNLTYTLAHAFQQYSQRIRATASTAQRGRSFLTMAKSSSSSCFDKQFAINLVSCGDYYDPDEVKDSEA
uniref:PID domain-containing protein n=1 Tax=Cacopsylla melanoneura TaxID=428564 RepID=A0A8D8SK71_9HEMI